MCFTSGLSSNQSPYIINRPSQNDPNRRRRFWKKLLRTLSIMACAANVVLIIVLIIVLAVLFSRNYDLPTGLESNIISAHIMEPLFVYMIYRADGSTLNTNYLKILRERRKVQSSGMTNDLDIQEMRNFGRIIHNRYIRGPPFVQKNEVYIGATDGQRTYESARNILIGMECGGAQIDMSFAVQKDYDIDLFHNCPRTIAINAVQSDQNFRHKQYSNGTVRQNIPRLSWKRLLSRLGIEPFNEELRKSRCGGILRTVANILEKRISCISEMNIDSNCEKKLYIVSAHEVTVIALITNFPKWDLIMGNPPQLSSGANVAVELWRINQKFMVKILYSNSYYATPFTITQYVSGCTTHPIFCPLRDLLIIWRKLYYSESEQQRICKL